MCAALALDLARHPAYPSGTDIYDHKTSVQCVHPDHFNLISSGMLLNAPSSLSIACFGETLWDILPRGIFLGGAPLNVAYHLSRHGVTAVPVSAVGRDFLGDEALRRIASWGVDCRAIARHATRPTGTVRATLDSAGVASYRIAEDVAWDRIVLPRFLLARPSPAALVFGTLALREEANRRTLERLLGAWPRSLRVLDLNLRTPFDRSDSIAFALRNANVVKLNDDELRHIAGHRGRTPGQLEQAARRFSAAHDIASVCVTAGARGAGLLRDDRWFWQDAQPVTVRDTIGAGDAFLAALLSALLARDAPTQVALARACRMGEFVAARDGATPPYTCDRQGRPRDLSK